MNLRQKLSKIQQEFKAKKSRYNSFGRYNFRSAEDILEAIKPFEKELDVYVVVTEEVITNDPFPIIKSTATIVDCESKASEVTAITATAIVGVDLDQKGMQMPQKFGSASSYGKKYALGNLFLIDDTADADAVNTHGKGGAKAKPKLTGDALSRALNAVKDGKFTADYLNGKYTISPADLKKLKSAEPKK
jgi:hypothetical protein